MDIIYANDNGFELGFLPLYADVDIDIGDTNDFVVTTNSPILDYKYLIYEDGTENGGIVRKIVVDTEEGTIKYCGPTWRGMLSQKIVIPPSSTYFIANGSASSIVYSLLYSSGLSDLFVADTDSTNISEFKFERYCKLLDGIEKMYASKGRKMSLAYNASDRKVHIKSVPIFDYSNDVELSQDGNIKMRISQNKGFVNHLILLGAGQLADRLVLHLYVSRSGEIITGDDTMSPTVYYLGADEISDTYEDTSAEDEYSLYQKGYDKLKELANQNEIETSVSDNSDYEVHDIIGGKERITGVSFKTSIKQKIISIKGGELSIQYKTE